MRPMVAPPPGGRTLPTVTSLIVSNVDLKHDNSHSPNQLGVDLSALDDLDENSLEEVLLEHVLEATLAGLVVSDC